MVLLSSPDSQRPFRNTFGRTGPWLVSLPGVKIMPSTARLLFSHSALSDSVTPWTVAHQAPLSMGLPRWEYWSGLPFSSPGDRPDPGIELAGSLCHWATEGNEGESSVNAFAVSYRNLFEIGRKSHTGFFFFFFDWNWSFGFNETQRG